MALVSSIGVDTAENGPFKGGMYLVSCWDREDSSITLLLGARNISFAYHTFVHLVSHVRLFLFLHSELAVSYFFDYLNSRSSNSLA